MTLVYCTKCPINAYLYRIYDYIISFVGAIFTTINLTISISNDSDSEPNVIPAESSIHLEYINIIDSGTYDSINSILR